jgi:hypothetical protein
MWHRALWYTGAKLHGVTSQKTFNVSINTETEKQDQNKHDTRRIFVVSYGRFGTDNLSGNVDNQQRTYVA